MGQDFPLMETGKVVLSGNRFASPSRQFLSEQFVGERSVWSSSPLRWLELAFRLRRRDLVPGKSAQLEQVFVPVPRGAFCSGAKGRRGRPHRDPLHVLPVLLHVQTMELLVTSGVTACTPCVTSCFAYYGIPCITYCVTSCTAIVTLCTTCYDTPFTMIRFMCYLCNFMYYLRNITYHLYNLIYCLYNFVHNLMHNFLRSQCNCMYCHT